MRRLRIVAVLNTKGGVGKTMLTRSLAVAASKPVKRVAPLVAMIDLDPQKTLEGWFELRGNKTDSVMVNGVSTRNPDLVRDERLEQAIETLEKKGYDWLFVDSPPAFISELEEAAKLANYIVIPTRPDIENMKASRDAIVIARQATKDRYVVVINSAPPRSSQETATRATLGAAGLAVAKQTIWQRVSHSKAADQGKTGAEIDDEAAHDIEKLWDEVRRLVLLAKPNGG